MRGGGPFRGGVDGGRSGFNPELALSVGAGEGGYGAAVACADAGAARISVFLRRRLVRPFGGGLRLVVRRVLPGRTVLRGLSVRRGMMPCIVVGTGVRAPHFRPNQRGGAQQREEGQPAPTGARSKTQHSTDARSPAGPCKSESCGPQSEIQSFSEGVEGREPDTA